MADRLKEEEEIAETKRRDEEEKLQEKQRDPLKLLSGNVSNGSDMRGLTEGPGIESTEKAVEKDYEGVSGNENHTGKLSLSVFVFCFFFVLMLVCCSPTSLDGKNVKLLQCF
jgi:hypothetical protein